MMALTLLYTSFVVVASIVTLLKLAHDWARQERTK
jgi:hypothetical protein